jgi:hypothetical protein
MHTHSLSLSHTHTHTHTHTHERLQRGVGSQCLSQSHARKVQQMIVSKTASASKLRSVHRLACGWLTAQKNLVLERQHSAQYEIIVTWMPFRFKGRDLELTRASAGWCYASRWASQRADPPKHQSSFATLAVSDTRMLYLACLACLACLTSARLAR